MRVSLVQYTGISYALEISTVQMFHYRYVDIFRYV